MSPRTQSDDTDAGSGWHRGRRQERAILKADIMGVVDQMNAELDAVIVEGERDRRAVRAAGFEGRILTFSESAGVHPFLETVEGLRVTILTDYDREGRRINARLRTHLSDRYVEPRWRRELGRLLTQQGRYDVESMNNLFAGDGLPLERSTISW